MNTGFLGPAVATVLTVYGIETLTRTIGATNDDVATVLTVYGIETSYIIFEWIVYFELQQYLPFTVLKLEVSTISPIEPVSCNSTYRLRY